MIDVVVVYVSELKSYYYLSPNDMELFKGESVIFENDGGLLFGTIFKEKYSEKKENLLLPLSKVIRKAKKGDKKKYEDNKTLSNRALIEAKNLSADLDLDMNFVDSFIYFDSSQFIFSFLSDSRVDFRELAKKLAQKYKTRIELRQIGVRDKARKIGGLGPCGLFLCCNSFLNDFNSVSINMAKNQMLALNPSKINGICGRLLCCLGYENDNYTELKKGLPKLGLITETEFGMGKVVAIDIIKNTYSVDLKENGIVVFSGDDYNNGKIR